MHRQVLQELGGSVGRVVVHAIRKELATSLTKHGQVLGRRNMRAGRKETTDGSPRSFGSHNDERQDGR